MKKVGSVAKPARLLKQSNGEWLVIWYVGNTRYRKQFHLNAIEDLAVREQEASKIIALINSHTNKSDVESIAQKVASREYESEETSRKAVALPTPLIFFDDFLALREPLLAKNTMRAMRNIRNAFSRYAVERLHRDATWGDFAHKDFFFRYQAWCFAQKMSANYVAKHFDIFRRVLREAVEQYPDQLNFSEPKIQAFRVKKTETDGIALTMREVEQVANCDLDGDLMRQVRDMFVLGCLTGLRFQDFSGLKTANITYVGGHTMLDVLTQKTGERVLIPLHPLAKTVWERLEKAPNLVSNQVFNRYIKKIAKQAGLTQFVAETKNVGGKMEARKIAKWKLVKSHVCRRTFATVAFLEWQVPTAVIMRITGHKTERIFFDYVKISKQQAAIAMQKVFASLK